MIRCVPPTRDINKGIDRFLEAEKNKTKGTGSTSSANVVYTHGGHWRRNLCKRVTQMLMKTLGNFHRLSSIWSLKTYELVWVGVYKCCDPDFWVGMDLEEE